MSDGDFFFQAEDGIRDLVRSRGLGDVYKRQIDGFTGDQRFFLGWATVWRANIRPEAAAQRIITAVSYTHLTLPTSDLV